MLYMAYIAHVVTGAWCDEVGICDTHVCTVCVLLVGYRFQPERRCNHRPQPISEGHRPVFLVPALCGGPRPPKAGLCYRIGWVNPQSERTTEIFISAVGGIRILNFLIDSQSSVLPLRYHRPLSNTIDSLTYFLTSRTLHLPRYHSVEVIAVNVRGAQVNVVVVVIYRPGSKPIDSEFFHGLDDVIERVDSGRSCWRFKYTSWRSTPTVVGEV